MADENYWVPTLSPKQQVVFNVGTIEDAGTKHPDAPTALLLSGERKTGKTIGLEHRLCRHLWETPAARVALIAKAIRVMTDGGIWPDLLDLIIPQWVDSGIGFEYTTIDSAGRPGPKMDPKTRTVYFRVRNMHGGESEVRLLSVEHDFEVKEKLKGSRFSMIWFNELSHFLDPDVFRTSIMQLRMTHLAPWQHLWVADTNPSDEGEDSWIYKLWYLRKLSDKLSRAEQEQFARSLRLIEIHLEDNPFMSEGEKAHMRALYADDEGEFAREVEGKWVKGTGGRSKHFADLFSPSIHVVGGQAGEGDQIATASDTTVLFTGWDLGSVNHAAVILERRLLRLNDRELSVWSVLDDLLILGEAMTVTEFTKLFLEKMDGIEFRARREFQWVHWSDDSAFNVFRGSGSGYDHLEVLAASHNKVRLQAVSKPEGSVQTRVRILRRLLKERRLYISKRCLATSEMLEKCSKGKEQKQFVEWNQYKHTFDALTYPLFMEGANELFDSLARPEAVQESEPQKTLVLG